jgi:hypothetical protein
MARLVGSLHVRVACVPVSDWLAGQPVDTGANQTITSELVTILPEPTKTHSISVNELACIASRLT